jgi:hypothetical protein
MPTTAKGFRFPTAADAADVPLDLGNLAADVDAKIPAGITQAARDALTGADLWNGRLIVNTTSGDVERYDLPTTTWEPVGDSPVDLIMSAALFR